MGKSKGVALTILMVILGLYANGQTVNVLRYDEVTDQCLHAEIKGSDITVEATPDFFKKYYGLEKGHEFKVERSLSGNNGELHVRFYHYYNGIEVMASELIGHYRNNILQSFNGRVHSFKTQVNPALMNEKALELALQAVPSEQYMWEDPDEEAFLKQILNDQGASYYPHANLIYAPKDLNFELTLELCYWFEIYSKEPLAKKRLYINATSGEVWASEDLIHETDVKGQANTKYRGVMDITTDSVGPNNYRLRETGRGKGIETYNMQKGTSYAAAVDFSDSDNYWNNYNAAYDEVAGDAHFGAEITYDYYMDKFSRNSFDGNGAKILSYVHYRSNYANAFWNGVMMTYGDGNGTTVTPLTSIDVCGHEVTHAVTTNSANLIYSWESGALNESFSDIFGNSIEHYADPSQFNWRIGEDIIVSGNGIRNMADPNTHGDPDTYKGLYWHTAFTDNGGVHTNSGVQNYWYYLLCVGKTGVNDNSDTFSVDSIGMQKAEAIAYRNLTVYLGRSSNYSDARYYGIRSAADLFGPCSDEVIATTNAWYAVGVGPEYDSALVVADFVADTAFCFGYEVVNFQNLSMNAKSYVWSFGDGDTSHAISPMHQYFQQGAFDVELIAEGCFFGISDTMTKTDYIEIDSTRDICNAVLMTRGEWDTVYVCNTFVYDHGGDENYTNLIKDTLTLVYDPSDSATLQFEEFDYENRFDSIYIYDGYNTSAPLIGGYTGKVLPNNGLPIKLTSGAVTIRHFSDPFVVGTGFKAYLRSYRDSLTLEPINDTLLCYRQLLQLTAKGSGGYRPDHGYWWNGIEGDSTFQLVVEKDTTIILKFGDRCLQEYILDTIVVTVLDSLKLQPIEDSVVCFDQLIDFELTASGGDSSTRALTWLPYNVQVPANQIWSTTFRQDADLTVILSDGCTEQTDTIAFSITVRDSLSWTPPADTMICQGTKATLKVAVTGGMEEFWFMDGTDTLGPSAELNQEFWPVNSGPYLYKYRVTDHCTGGEDTISFRFVVRDSLGLTVSDDTLLCDGGYIDLKAAGIGGVSSSQLFEWSPGSATGSSFKAGPFYSDTVFYVILSDGCSVYEPFDSVLVTVRPPLDVQIDGPDLLCYKELGSWQATVTGGDPSNYSYLWSPSGATTSDISFRPVGQSSISVMVSDGCSERTASDDHIVRTRDQLVLDLSNDTAICFGKSVVLKANTSGGITSSHVVVWNNGLGSGSQKVVKPAVTTVYDVTLSDNCSEDVSKSVVVTVNPLPVVDYSIQPNPWCTGREITFTDESDPGVTYLWNFGDGGTSGARNAVHKYSDPGVYSIGLIVTDANQCIDSMVRDAYLTIVEHPVANFTINPLSGNFFESEITFTSTSQFEQFYFWDLGDGGVSTQSSFKYDYQDTGVYRVMLVAGNSIGCQDTAYRSVEIEDVFVLHVPNAFTPNGDALHQTFGVYQRGVESFHMVIFNRWGEVLWETDDVNGRWDGVYLEELLPAGNYFYQIDGVNYSGEPFSTSGTVLLMR